MQRIAVVVAIDFMSRIETLVTISLFFIYFHVETNNEFDLQIGRLPYEYYFFRA